MSKPDTFLEDPLAGLTILDCPVECTKDKCVITEWGVCGHPKKSGLQGADRSKPDVLERYNAARRRLAIEAVERKIA